MSLEKFIGVNLKKCKSLGWFGLTADPPSLAHRAVVDAVLGSGLVDKVIVFPSGKLDYKSFVASDWQRAEMSELWIAAAEFADEVVLSRFDMLRDKSITWITLWKKITELAPSINHYLILGSDQYQEIPLSWNKGEELLEYANFIVVPRKGFELKKLSPNHHLLDVEPIEGSSTEFRKGDISLVDEQVKKYILENELY